MKLAVVGSSEIIDNPHIQDILKTQIQLLKPSVIVLVPNRKFNTFVKEIATKNGISVDEMEPPKPTWLGAGKISYRKEKCRSLYGYYVTNRADLIICYGKKGAKGLSYRPIIEFARGKVGISEYEIDPSNFSQETSSFGSTSNDQTI